MIHLVLFSDTEYYHSMYNITSPYYKSFDIKTVYYIYADIEEEYRMEDDILYIKGKETYTPGILEKTIKAFEYFKGHDIIRSNISTIVDFNCLDTTIPAYGGNILDLHWTCKGSGIVDTTFFGTKYVAGICIFLSKETIQLILEKQTFLRKDIIDDLAIGILLKENGIYPESFGKIGKTFYRNRSNNRKQDCINMKKTIESLK